MSWRRAIEPAVRPLLRNWWRLSRGATLGVRALVEDERGRVLMVKHTYMHGWHLPGGGVERDETAQEAVIREVREEAGVALADAPALIGVYANHRFFRGDHVLLFHAARWTRCATDCAGEIEAADWFALDALPEDASAATRRRLAERYESAPQALDW